ncbi:MAG: type 2 lantipeptide synthetase LanM family protein [Actinobacteria bacterium]|nr:type 2 lantipeptide synthetase LanM family protein [Actinomycetota bacterium]
MPAEEGGFDSCLGCLIDPALGDLAAELDGLAFLGRSERAAVLAGVADLLLATLRRKLSRLLVVELNLASTGGTLLAGSAEARWQEFLDRASRPSFWQGLSAHYPTLLTRLRAVVTSRCAAGAELGRRFGADRTVLGELTSNGDGELTGNGDVELTAVGFGSGDSHRGGRSVARLDLGGASAMYKPRSLAVDAALGRFLDRLFDAQQADRIRVPRVLERQGYGWTEFVGHRLCESAAELRGYYTGIGHWLALARLFGATDLHAENLIAAGPAPVIVDCETLFTPWLRVAGTGMGEATDRALRQLHATVLLTGLLPGRGSELGWRGVDISAVGALPGEQPDVPMPYLAGAGTDRARVALRPAPVAAAANLPSREPVLDRHWPDVIAGFEELTARLTRLDRAGELAPALAGFAGVEVRGILRATETYAELTRMLWHPVSLHDEPAAVARATALLITQGGARPSAPSDPAVVAAEVAELLHDDIPVFSTSTADGQLTGPAGTRWGEPHDLVADALASWRAADLAVERELIRMSPLSAYSGEGWRPDGDRLPMPERAVEEPAALARRLAGSAVTTLRDTAVRGSDGTVTWIAPVFNSTGWAVQPLSLDGYSGLAGVAVALAGYRHAVDAGQAAPVDGLDELLTGTVHSMRAAFDRNLEIRASSRFTGRPKPPGLYVGLGSQIWGWLWLVGHRVVDPAELDRAVTLAGLLPQSVAATEESDVLVGAAGAVVALLMLAEHTGEQRWLEQAAAVGTGLVLGAHRSAGTACWPSARAPHGMGGFAHGSTGIGWALARLSMATGDRRFTDTAEAALAFDRALYQPGTGRWGDLRELGETPPAWCHGAVGIGVAAADLIRLGFGDPDQHAEVVRRAAAASWPEGMGFNHSICHGDLGCWELLAAAADLGVAPDGLDHDAVTGYPLVSIAEHGPVTGVSRQVFSPGLLPGLAGVAYQLLRMAPGSELGSVLVPERALDPAGRLRPVARG